MAVKVKIPLLHHSLLHQPFFQLHWVQTPQWSVGYCRLNTLYITEVAIFQHSHVLCKLLNVKIQILLKYSTKCAQWNVEHGTVWRQEQNTHCQISQTTALSTILAKPTHYLSPLLACV